MENQNFEYQNNNQYPQRSPDYTLEIISLVLGIIGLITSFIPCFYWFALLFLIPSLILGIVAISKTTKNRTPKGFAIAATVVGSVGMLICIVWHTIFAAALTSVARDIDNTNSYYDNTLYQDEYQTDSIQEDTEYIWTEDTEEDD
ncbi:MULTISPECIES: DUF4190 domain-containing protein [Myroides]|uniref:DUF4190 domain-containing protein n=1 Tax=Myroides albus TaxID=2562892 RepID=A0A6I3LMV5_9FLAO|nr:MULTISPECIES: DUF4190 domain-containing protein [Myroides]MTG97325.1 hypothetical protein [Myroides albus]MVX35867.1 hypothetical protein [Myroides sp. LoEW2-1]UVD80588.1 DUF4190 domain-containing protein [Myroides albus]